MNASYLAKGFLGQNKYDKVLWNCIKVKDKIRNENIYTAYRSNSKYKDQYKGKRCFILGNGPSLRDVNFEQLKNEIVFSVNSFSQVENYSQVSTNVHLWMDLSFFQMRNEQKYDENVLMENYYKIAKEKPICFVPTDAYAFIKEKKLDHVLDINYLRIYKSIDESSVVKYDISNPITGFNTVVQYGILVAIYMGIKEIYLLGCDSTNIISMLNVVQGISNQKMHAYDNDDVDERYRSLTKEWGMSKVFYDQYKLFLGYKRLYTMCLSKNIKLVNCSASTIITEIPRQTLESVLMGS